MRTGVRARLVAAGLLLALVAQSAAGAADPVLPELTWEQRSDWINVKTGMAGIGPTAVGDGVTDDTAALQAAFDAVREQGGAWSTVYLPPGTYRITSEIYPKHARHDAAMHLRGHGRSTRIVWHGEAGGRMFRSDSAAFSTYIGVVWDGRGVAARGFMHDSRTVRETKVLHQHEAFLNFTEEGSGTARGKRNSKGDYQVYLEGSEYRNCLFVNCGKGLVLWDHNDYLITLDGCEFHDNGHGIWSKSGTFFVRNSHFQRSKQADIVNSNDTSGCSARRVTSIGSRAFYERAGSGGGTPFTMQDCHVSGWTNPDHAITTGSRAQKPMLIFDCCFTDAPSANPPIHLQAPTPVVHSNNKWSPGGTLVGGSTQHVREIPAGRRGGSIASARQRFFKAEVAMPTKVFDARQDFGAKADGRTDDTAAVQRTIEAARQHGGGAIAYLPQGRYSINRTITITGSNYHVGGAGGSYFNAGTAITWAGDDDGPIFLVADPGNVTMENIGFWMHKKPGTVVSIRQVSTTKHPSRMHYEQVCVFSPGRPGAPATSNGDFEAVGLAAGSVLTASGLFARSYSDGRHLFDDCSSARILLNHVNGNIAVKGTEAPRTGFLGAQVHQGSFVIEDNQSIVASDSYFEQGPQEYARLLGSAGPPAGRVSLSSPRLHTWNKRTVGCEDDFVIVNYRGSLALVGGRSDSSSEPKAVHRIRHTGSSPCDIVWMADTYSTAAPTFDLQPHAVLTVLGCWVQRPADDHGPSSIPDVIHPESLLRASEALDHFRELGEHDLTINHGIDRAIRASP